MGVTADAVLPQFNRLKLPDRATGCHSRPNAARVNLRGLPLATVSDA